MQLLISLLSGLIFGVGLILSGMTNPAKVIGFLDIFGHWDPSLAFVMGGAIAIGVMAFGYAKSRSKALLGAPMRLPISQKIDLRLLVGALAFGAGWGLAGFCPGPAIVSLTSGGSKAWIFTLAMLAGMGIFEMGERLFQSTVARAK